MNEPRTKAGRLLAGWDIANSDEEQADLVAAILAIEDEARAEAARETEAPLSVERLALAIEEAGIRWSVGRQYEIVEDIAREYARLTPNVKA